MASERSIEISRRRFVAGADVLAVLTLPGGVAGAARPTITVHKDPT